MPVERPPVPPRRPRSRRGRNVATLRRFAQRGSRRAARTRPRRPPGPSEATHARRSAWCSLRGYTARAAGVTRNATPAALDGLLLVELQRARVDAVTLARVARTVREHVAKMPSAGGTVHLDAVHAVAEIVKQLDVGAIRRLGEAGPASARLELRLRGEKLCAAPGATVRPVTLLVDVLAGECPLGSLLPEHLVLSRGQLPAPFVIALLDATSRLVRSVWFWV